MSSHYLTGFVCNLLFIVEFALVFSLESVSTSVITEFDIRTSKLDGNFRLYKHYNALRNKKKNTFILQPGTKLEIFCDSRAHIEWEAPLLTDVRFSIESRKILREGVFVYTSVLTSLVDISDTGVYKCLSSGETRQFYIFVKGNSSFVPLSKNEEDEALSNGILPCRVTYPTLNVTLFKLEGGKRTELFIPYNPKIGFTIQSIVDLPGTFECKIDSERVIYNITSRIYCYPETKEIMSFEGQIFSTSCTCNDSTILRSDISYNVEIGNYSIEYRNITKLEYKGNRGEKGTISYFQKENMLYKWSFEIIANPRIEWVPATGSVKCWTKASAIHLNSLKCDSSNMCRIRAQCFDEPNKCPGLMYEGNSCSSKQCSRLIDSHNAGVLMCNADGAKMTLEYFTGLNHLRYVDWNDAPGNALIRLDEIDPIIYNNPEETPYFYCEATRFLFMEELQFAFLYKNHSYIKIPDESMKVDSKVNRQFGKNIIGRGAYINVTEDIRGIKCRAPWRNISRGYYKKLRKFEVKNVQQPTIQSHLTTITFTEGDENANIQCVAEGQPPPDVFWLQNNKSVEPPLKTDKNGVWLIFPKITPKFTGTYICQAKNDVGITEASFNVNVVDGLHWTIAQKLGLSLGIFAVLGCIMFAMFLLWRKHNFIINHLRDLTDQEIDEFLKGNPDLLNSEHFSNEMALHLPYNNEYEIPYQHLLMDTKNVLGSGDYGMVYRGVYRSDVVAVKTTKPNAEVSYFKSLLSELKIIMHLGRHPNIVEFIGSCTEKIKTRVVYVVFELSTLGNLNDFLRDQKMEITQSMNVKHNSTSIVLTDLSRYNNSGQITPANMVSWSIQIAEGMAHLEYKKVVHGDMATRNVLLFPDNVVKITDFGLSKQLYNYSHYVKRQKSPLPWRWLAIETLKDHSFSVKSDVWAYGVTVWEIFSLGSVPFPNRDWTEDFVEDLVMGMRLNCPRRCHKKLYEIMLECWNEQPNLRPNFQFIIQQLKAEATLIQMGY